MVLLGDMDQFTIKAFSILTFIIMVIINAIRILA